ncbi:hypothetical protein BD410DRAFT_798298 [Rickenella mellea]|uniref:CASTOR ACT domain-containing protein n=1 Tax=Rickenella mellea TaxID=50990 RepID=A0A4R5XF84_9AGAM|nr:hypothetical protein BD410DRAFT_798298 [Rickenella mellea]
MSDNNTAALLTITLLPATLSLVHIPRPRVPELSRPILKQILHNNHCFLNLTCNQIELSIFAENELLSEFEPYAWKDRQKQRQRERARSTSSLPGGHRRRQSAAHSHLLPVEKSMERWRVLQIDSHEDSLSHAGARVRELSAPLAAAGISILYQSSYMSDFIFVKASRLAEAISLLGAAGFEVYSDSVDSQLSPSDDNSSFMSLHELSEAFRQPTDGLMLSKNGSASGIDDTDVLKTPPANTAAGSQDVTTGDSSGSKIDSAPLGGQRSARKSMSPTAAPVDVLSPDLACVGLNDDAADVWSVKIMKLVAFPELIPSRTPGVYRGAAYSRKESLASDTFSPAYEFLAQNEMVLSSKPVPRPCLSPSSSDGSMSQCSSSEDEEEYFSAPSPYNRSRDDVSTPSLISASSSSLPDDVSTRQTPRHPLRRPPLTRLTTNATPTASAMDQPPLSARSLRSDAYMIKGAARQSDVEQVPFFSFTRTSEGSSLTTDVKLLASLFAPHERHMVICRDDLLEAVDRDAEQEYSGIDAGISEMDFFDGQSGSIDGAGPETGTMKCLQIDLQRFGLDKHGLVNRFSHVLDDNGINHMYSSTYKTANLLVDKVNALRARSLLRSC